MYIYIKYINTYFSQIIKSSMFEDTKRQLSSSFVVIVIILCTASMETSFGRF